MNIIERFQGIIGKDEVKTDSDSLASYGSDWLKAYPPAPRCVVRPRTTEEVAAIVRVCHDSGTPIVPSGGRTGLSGGAAATNGEVVLSLERMSTIDPPSTIDRTVRCEAGAITERLQQVALGAGLYFPVDFASRGSSQIGGNIATNAGGLRVLRYGNMRDWVLGLTVVTGTGEILELNGNLFKNNSGYDLRGLIIGSEGTLGIVTGAILKLTTPPLPAIRILCGLERRAALPSVLDGVRKRFPQLSLFEFFSRNALECVVAHNPLRDPFGAPHTTYALIDIDGDTPALRSAVEEWLHERVEHGEIADAVIAQGASQATELLALRENIGATIAKHHTIHKNDIAVPVPLVDSFLEALEDEGPHLYPDAQLVIFGHLADGNIHFNVLKPKNQTPEAFTVAAKKADEKLFTLVRRFHGTVSAEHGVGLLKKEFLHFTRTAAEIEIMRSLKRAFDPAGILNPGKIFD